MTWAIHWRSDEPERVVQRLVEGLGIGPVPVAGRNANAPGWAFEFPSGRLTVDRAAAGGRSGLAIDAGDGETDALSTALPLAPAVSLAAPIDGPDLAAVGWATVELERAAVDLGVDLVPLPDDELLGAMAAQAVARPGSSLARTAPEARLVLLEPTTEGGLAASLARRGEGPAVVYFVAGVPGRSPTTGRTAAGPFGHQVLLTGGPPWGPHVVLGDRLLPRPDDGGTMPSMMDERAIALRGAALADAGRIAALLTDEGYPAGATDIEERLGAFDSPTSTVIVAESGGEVLGFIALHVVPRFEHGDRFVRVVALIVDPGVRDRGLGHRLMAEGERLGREMGAAFVEVTSGHHRPEARRFYESLGYDASVTAYLRKRI